MRIKEDEVINKKRKEILNVTKEIIIDEGISGVSMRKIAKHLNQVPGNLYHYIKKKEEILYSLVKNEYEKIVKVVSNKVEGTYKEQLVIIMKQYINLMIDNYTLFDVMNHINNAEIQQQLYILTPGISQNRKSIQSLYQLLSRGCKNGNFNITNLELRAQLIISGAQGVVQRIAIEQPNNKEEIINEYISIILQSIEGEKQ
ncbi:MAG: TetR/AcrR family transcriptional regulator [Coprobacillaceae bacterium]